MGYTEEKKQQKQDAKEQAEKARVAEAFRQFFDMNRDRGIIDCMANESILRAFFGDETDNISLQTLNDAVQHTSVSQQLARQSEHVEREKLVRYILSNRTMSPDTEKHERARLLNEKLTHIDTVRTIADNIKRKRELAALSTDELKAVARGPEPNKFMDVPPYFRTRNTLIDCANTDLPLFKRLIQKCGRAAIDAILQAPEEE
jgi:hypothetical protein